MPGRVTSFFRSPNDSINSIKNTVQRRRSPNRNTRVQGNQSPRPGSVRTISYSSDPDDDSHLHHSFFAPPVRMPSDSAKDKDKKDVHHHRISFPNILGSKSQGHKESKQQNPNATLGWKVESPPAVMYGDAENSSGALYSGQVLLDIKQTPVEVEYVNAELKIHVTQKRPFQAHCHDCINQYTEIKTWKLLREPTTLDVRSHNFPFSVLLEGHLPATTDNPLMSIQYEFTAEAKLKTGSPLKLFKTIDVRRSLGVPEVPHHSVRVFPPTTITSSVHYPQVIHPIGSNTLTMRLDGIVKPSTADEKSNEYWKLKRLTWKLEENYTTVAPACEKHAPKATGDNEAHKKGLKRTDGRTIGSGDLTSGWKSDYTSADGTVEMELDYQANTNTRPVCDLKSRDGSEVSHQLILEMVVVQEYAPKTQPKHVTPTGVARILRMHYSTVITERGGLGVSWDNEAPPIYQDVPPSPPAYNVELIIDRVEDLNLSAH